MSSQVATSPVLQTSLTPHQQVDQLYKSHHTWLKSWIQHKVSCHYLASELAQDTFLRLLTRNKVIEFDSLLGVKRYLRTIGNGLCVDTWRKAAIEKAWLEAVSLQPQSLAISAEEHYVIIETLCDIDQMLQRLPEKVARAFIMSQVDGLTYQKIALKLEVSVRMVKKYMARAMMECMLLEVTSNSCDITAVEQ
ncbi:sigma-70 family RNA polymerase sigma factor [Colwellia asteriadis]|uniref:Sigma-70 family RNA polymerase sigma factor n=1 Tax=Colwellia asteriadis TaxID=517723 RepID=A0ABN1L756_9GAMM